MFFIDFNQHINEFNIKLQGVSKIITDMFDLSYETKWSVIIGSRRSKILVTKF